MKKYNPKVINKLSKYNLNVIKAAWTRLKELEKAYYDIVRQLEVNLEQDTGIKGIEFITDGGGYFGVGTADRSMKLLQAEDLKKRGK